MGALNQKSKFKPAAPQIRVQRVPIERPTQPKPKPSPTARPSSSNNLLQQRAKPRQKNNSKSASPHPAWSSADEGSRRAAKRKAPGGGSSRSPSVVKFDSSDDTDGDEDGGNGVFLRRKKRRSARVDPDRKLRHPQIWTGAVDETEKSREPGIMHSAELANLASKCQPALGIPETDVGIELRYPGGRGREGYALPLAGGRHTESVRGRGEADFY